MHPGYLLLGAVVIIVLAVIIYRSIKGPKAPAVNPFDAVRPSRGPIFPDADGAAGSAKATTAKASSGSTSAVAARTTDGEPFPGSSEVEQSAPESAEAEADADAEPTIAGYIEQAEQEVKDGELDSAIESLDSAIDLAIREHGVDSLEHARLLVKLGEVYQARDYEDEADGLDCQEYLFALALMQQRLGPKSEQLLPVLTLLVSWYDQTGDQSKSEAVQRRIAEINEYARAVARENAEFGHNVDVAAVQLLPTVFSVPFKSTVDDAVNFCKEGDEFYADGEFEDAVASYRSAIESVQSEVGRGAPELAILFHRLGRAYQVKDGRDSDDEGDAYTDPADNYQIALSLLVKQHGVASAELAAVLLDLASFEDQRGDHYKADSYLRRMAEVKANRSL
jgi:hypothetical protein